MFINFKKIFNNFLLTAEQQAGFKEHIEEEIKGEEDVFILTFFAAILLTFGLVLDNFFITLGGLLLTPIVWLMLAISLKIIQNQLKDLAAGLIFLGKVGLLTIIASFVFGGIFSANYEAVIAVRPTFLEFATALVVGFLATFIVSYPKLGSFIARMLAGAVIMLPLCLIGIALAHMDLAKAAGGFLQFIINFIALFIGTVLFLLPAGFKSKLKIKLNLKSKTVLVALVLLAVIIFVASAFILDSYSSKRRQYNLVKATLEQNLGESQINHLDIYKEAEQLIITATISAKKNLSSREINLLAAKLSQATNRSVSLQITAIFNWQAEKTINPSAKDNQTKGKQNNQQLGGIKSDIFPKILNQ